MNSSDSVRVIPLGGLNSFGKNCCLLEHDDSLIMLDCGVSFPDHPGYGLDYLLPDWTHVVENADRLDAIVLTHGHEDHIGAMPFLLSTVDAPVYGGKLAVAMVRARLEEHGVEPRSGLHAVSPGEIVEIGPWELEFVHVNHSIPDTMCVAARCAAGTVLFTGDWKIDHTPVIGEPADLAALALLGEEDVLAVVGDSTNSIVPGYTRSEREVVKGLETVVREAPGRVIVGQFSSNQERVQGLLEIAHRQRKKLVLLGRSLEQNFRLCRDLGIVRLPADDLVVPPEALNTLDPRDTIVVCTGTQAEPRATLTRIANGEHNLLRLRDDDTVVISARLIPGNEAAIHSMIGNLVRRGARIIMPNQAPVHASGHAKREELKLLLNLVRPRWVVPVHGDYRMRLAHAELAADLGFQHALIDDGDVLALTEASAEVVGRVPLERVVVDGKLFADLADSHLKERRALAVTGIVVALAVIDTEDGSLVHPPALSQRGFLSEADEHLLAQAAEYALEGFEELDSDERRRPEKVAEVLRIHIRRFFRKAIHRKPVVVPLVHDVAPD